MKNSWTAHEGKGEGQRTVGRRGGPWPALPLEASEGLDALSCVKERNDIGTGSDRKLWPSLDLNTKGEVMKIESRGRVPSGLKRS